MEILLTEHFLSFASYLAHKNGAETNLAETESEILEWSDLSSWIGGKVESSALSGTITLIERDGDFVIRVADAGIIRREYVITCNPEDHQEVGRRLKRTFG